MAKKKNLSKKFKESFYIIFYPIRTYYKNAVGFLINYLF
jgi:hypothetical protein